MFGTQPEMVASLRSMAREGVKPSVMLHRLISHHANLDAVDRNLLVQYFSEAFCFTDGEAYPIFGWFHDGTGELKDANLDYLLNKRIQRARGEWDAANLASHPVEAE